MRVKETKKRKEKERKKKAIEEAKKKTMKGASNLFPTDFNASGK